MKLLLIGDIGIIFTYEYVTEIAAKFSDCNIDILSFSSRKEANADREKKLLELGCNIYYQPQYTFFKKHKLLHVFIRLKEVLRYRICKNYDIINIHFPGIDAAAVCRWASSKARVITSLYGSDVLRASKRGIDVIKKLLIRSDVITVASRYIQERLSQIYNTQFDNKVELVRYGSKAAASMSDTIAKTSKQECKAFFGFPKEKTAVLCGYNGSRAQRHIEILNQLNKISGAIREKVFLVFQCSYGLDKCYHNELSAALAESPLEGKIVTAFLQGENLARFRNSIDIFLNLQPTDVLSATMIEELEAGAVVIKGDWLSYPDLDERNIYLHSIPSMNALSTKMLQVIAHYQDEKKKTLENKGIWELLSWEKQYNKWDEIIFGKEKL